MALFLAAFVNKVDRKGRVSVPAPFRAALEAQTEEAQTGGAAGLVLFRSHSHVCLEGFSMTTMQELSDRLDHFDLFSSEQDDLATAIFGAASPLHIDGDGRIVLPPDLISYAGLEEQAAFVGMGRKFQIWNPQAHQERQEEARQAVQSKGLTLPKGAGA